MALVEIARFADVYEAELAAAFLASHGVEASVADRNLSTIDPLMQRALGGARLMVPRRFEADARELLRRADSGDFAEADGDDIEKPIRSGGLVAATLAGAMLAPAAGLAMTGGGRPLGLVRRIGLALVALFIVGNVGLWLWLGPFG